MWFPLSAVKHGYRVLAAGRSTTTRMVPPVLAAVEFLSSVRVVALVKAKNGVHAAVPAAVNTKLILGMPLAPVALGSCMLCVNTQEASAAKKATSATTELCLAAWAAVGAVAPATGQT